MMKPSLNPAAWTEGMFLRPQHFQHLDRSANERLLYHARCSDPFRWGVRALEIDEEALANHQIRIERLEAVLPGGSIVRYPGNAVLEPRKFEPRDELDVWVGIRLSSSTSPDAVQEGTNGRTGRYVIRTHELSDLYREGEKQPIDLLHPNVRVFVSGEEPELELYESIKLVRIQATGDASRPYVISDAYVPPLLSVQAWTPLADEIASLSERMAGKIRMVAGKKGSMTALDVRRILMWYTLASLTPVLRHHLSAGETHPFLIYTILVEIAASVSALNRDEMLDIPAYDHTALRECYGKVVETINGELEHEFKDRSREVSMPFSRKFRAYATEERLALDLVDDRNDFYLAIRADLVRDELVSHVMSVGKVGAVEIVDQMVSRAVEGLKMHHIPAAPADVSTNGLTGSEFFRVDPRSNPRVWRRMHESASVGLHLGNLEGADVRLIVVQGAKEA